MRLDFEGLRCVKMMASGGLPQHDAEFVVQALLDMEVRNLYSKQEVDAMLSESNLKIFEDRRREFDLWLEKIDKKAEQADAKFYAEMRESRARFERKLEAESAERRTESRAMLRWVCGIIITCALGLAGYLSALIKLTH